MMGFSRAFRLLLPDVGLLLLSASLLHRELGYREHLTALQDPRDAAGTDTQEAKAEYEAGAVGAHHHVRGGGMAAMDHPPPPGAGRRGGHRESARRCVSARLNRGHRSYVASESIVHCPHGSPLESDDAEGIIIAAPVHAAGAKTSRERSEAQYTEMQYEREFTDGEAGAETEGSGAAPWLRRAAVPEEALLANNRTSSPSSDSLQRHCGPLVTKV